jgi:putative transposase
LGTSRFSAGTRLRWQEKTYEIRPSASVGTVTLREMRTEEETNVEMQVLLQALFSRSLFFLPRGQTKKSRKQAHPQLEEDLRVLGDYPPYLANIARYRLQAIWPLVSLEPKARTSAVVEARAKEVKAGLDPAFEGSYLGSVSKNSLYNWLHAYIQSNYDVRSLVPDTRLRGGKNKTRLDPVVEALVGSTIHELYKSREVVSIDDVLQEVACRVDESNLQQLASTPLAPPSRATVARRIEALGMIERFTIRHGKRLAEQKFAQYGANMTTDAPGVMAQIDHTRADFIAIDDRDNLPLGRPTFTHCLDVGTRYPLGYYIGFEPPSYYAVMECLYHAISPKEDSRQKYGTEHGWLAYGVPSTLVIDNGREFIGRDLSDACLSLGIILQQTPVRTPHFKAEIERGFGTIDTMLFHTLPGTTFSNPQERGDYNSLEEACVYLSDVEKILHTFLLDVYAETLHKGIEAIPARRWEEALQAGFLPTLPDSATDLQVLLGRVEHRAIWPYGVDFESIRYNCDDLLIPRTRLKGEKAKIKYHPGDLSRIYVFDPFDERYITVPALDQEYTRGLSLWKHRVIRNFASREQDKPDLVALGRAKRKIREIVEAGRERKRASTRAAMTRWETSGKPLRQVEQDTGQIPESAAPRTTPGSPSPTGSASNLEKPEAAIEDNLLASGSQEGWELDYSLSKEQ